MENYKKKVSFLIPTKRNYDTHIKHVINNINSFQSKMSYEICIYSKQEISGENVKWFCEDESRGPIYGFNYLANKCEGEYIICLTDDHILINSFESGVYDLEKNHRNDEYVITSLNPGGEDCCNPIKGQVLGDTIIGFECELFPLVRFPMMHKETFEKFGNVIFNESFYYHAGDIWLGYYLGKKGYKYHNSPISVGGNNPEKDSKYEVSDCNIARKLIEIMNNEDINYNFKI